MWNHTCLLQHITNLDCLHVSQVCHTTHGILYIQHIHIHRHKYIKLSRQSMFFYFIWELNHTLISYCLFTTERFITNTLLTKSKDNYECWWAQHYLKGPGCNFPLRPVFYLQMPEWTIKCYKAKPNNTIKLNKQISKIIN